MNRDKENDSGSGARLIGTGHDENTKNFVEPS